MPLELRRALPVIVGILAVAAGFGLGAYWPQEEAEVETVVTAPHSTTQVPTEASYESLRAPVTTPAPSPAAVESLRASGAPSQSQIQSQFQTLQSLRAQ